MQKNAYTSPLMMDIGMALTIFIIALLTILGTVLRLIASCINILARLIYVISNCSAGVYASILTWRRPEAIEYTVN